MTMNELFSAPLIRFCYLKNETKQTNKKQVLFSDGSLDIVLLPPSPPQSYVLYILCMI